jgi:proteasome-associated ATPase
MATNAELLDQLKAAKEAIVELQDMLNAATSAPRGIASVLRSVSPTEALVLVGNAPMRVTLPQNLGGVLPGEQVLISAQTKGVICKVEEPLPGKVVPFKRYIDDRFCEIEASVGLNDTRIVFCYPNLDLKPGDMAMTDPSSSVVLRNLGRPTLQGHKISEEFNVSWEDVGGLDHIREFFHEVFEYPILHPEVYARYNMKPPKGVLMTGPPGCGKSLVAKAVACTISNRNGNTVEGAFISVKGPEILSPYVGMAEAKIRDLFTAARDFYRQNGFPAVIFIDECEAVMSKRGSGRSSDVDKTIVPSFLTEMDGLEISGALIILATNRPDMLDPAIIREGRIDKKVTIPRPSEQACARIFEIHLRHAPLATGTKVPTLVDASTEYLFSEQHALYVIEKKSGGNVPFCLRDIVSGAMVATICQQAAQSAMSRDIRKGTTTGVKLDDVKQSIKSIVASNSHLDHKDEVAEFAAPWKSDIARVVKQTVEI